MITMGFLLMSQSPGVLAGQVLKFILSNINVKSVFPQSPKTSLQLCCSSMINIYLLFYTLPHLKVDSPANSLLFDTCPFSAELVLVLIPHTQHRLLLAVTRDAPMWKFWPIPNINISAVVDNGYLQISIKK